MTTQEQIDANRRNSQSSTGPSTPEGKAASRLNSLQHGLRAATLILPFERREDYDDLLASFLRTYDPTESDQYYLVEQMAVAQWKLARLERTENALRRDDPDGTQNFDRLERIGKQQSRMNRSFLRARQEIAKVRGARQIEAEKVRAAEEEERAANEPKIIKGLVWRDAEGNITDYKVEPCLKYPGQESVRFQHLDAATQEYWFPNDYQRLRTVKWSY